MLLVLYAALGNRLLSDIDTWREVHLALDPQPLAKGLREQLRFAGPIVVKWFTV